MESGEIIVEKKSASYMKVAQLHAACHTINGDSKGMRYFENILQKEGDINYDIKKCRDVVDSGKYLSVLHSAYGRSDCSTQVYQLFLNQGADYNVKDNENRTVVHRAIHDHHKKPEILRRYVDPVLSAQVKLGDISNPRCKYGTSHFHAACMTNHVEAVEFFLKNGAAVIETVNADSPVFAGFTPLHFAAKYSCLDAAEILLKYGAEVHLKNVARMSSVHLVVKQKIDELRESADKVSEKFIKLLLDRNIVDEFGFSNLHLACMLDDSTIAENILTDQSLDVNQSVKANSPVCPGYTPLHFAATFNMNTVKLLLKNGADIEAKDAENVTPFDLHLKYRSVDEIHYIISSQTKWKDIKLSDGKTRLLDVVSAMKSIEGFSYFLSGIEWITDLKIPIDSSLWPGYTMLHLAVMFSEKSEGHWSVDANKVNELLDRGADVTKKDANNATALHLAFYLQKYRTVKVLLRQHSNTFENPLNNNNLSHFHIACAEGVVLAIKRFLSQGVVINAPITSTIKWLIRPNSISNSKSKQMFLTAGSTALHISVARSRVTITKMLLKKGADIYAKDCNGLTPIHRLLTSRNLYFRIREIGKPLLRIDGLQDSIAPCGISHLHVACYSGYYNGVERLLNSGAAVNAFVKDISSKITREEEDDCFDIYGDPSKEPFAFLSRYSGFTALNFSLLNNNTDIQRLLIERGADAISKNSCERALVLDEEEVLKYLTYSGYNSDSTNRFKKRLAIPSLHIACYSKNLVLMSISLSQGDDVNARLSIPPRNTPLHILTKYNKDGNDNTYLIEFLLKNGADVTLRNDNGITAVDMFFLREFDYPSARQSVRSMLESIKDFDTNSINSQGFSFFHYACLTKVVKVVEKFLENGIDVNRSVDYFGERFAGCSPLHFASGYQSKNVDDVALQLQIVELLLRYGADTKAEDARGNTPLHSAAGCYSSRHVLFDTLIRNGADVTATNVNGEIALEILIKSRNATWEDIECLLKNTTHVKFYNPFNQDRYIDHLFLYHKIWNTDYNNAYDPYANRMNLSNYEILSKLIASEYVTRIDEDGRNFLQNLFFLACPNELQYPELIRQLVKRGCNINHRDNEGKTILHLATGFRHNECVVALLKNGADVNVTDNNGKTALAYCFDHPYEFHSSNNPQLVVEKFVEHLRKMERCKLYISDDNRQLQVRALGMLNLQENEPPDFLKNIEKAESIKMGSSDLTLFDFIEVDAEMVYPNMSHFVRLEIDQFFQHIDQHHLCEIDYLLKLKYERAREKMRLMSSAIESFLVIIKNQLPTLCCRLILSFLHCVDLENVITATED